MSQLLNQLTSLIDDPVGATKSQVGNWKWVCECKSGLLR